MTLIPVILCIDVEPDERLVRSPVEWKGLAATLQQFEKFRIALQRITGAPVHFNWFLRMDEQIKHVYGSYDWPAKRYRGEIQSLESAGDEIGLHLHSWHWNKKHWVANYADQRLINECLETSFEAYRAVFRRHCDSFRFGDHWMNNETMRKLQSLGVKFDLTVERGRVTCKNNSNEVVLGSFPDYTNVQVEPYKPSRGDFKKPGGFESPWVIPISTGKIPGRFPLLKRLYKTNVRTVLPLDLSLYAPNFRAITEQTLGENSGRFLAIVMRSDACLRYRTRAAVTRNINYLMSHPFAARFRFVNPEAAIELLGLATRVRTALSTA